MTKIECETWRGKTNEEYVLSDDVDILIVVDVTGDEIIYALKPETSFGSGWELENVFDPGSENRTKECIDRIYYINVNDEEEFNAWCESRDVPPENIMLDRGW